MGTLNVDKLAKTSTGAAEFTLPAADGTAGQVWQTDGAGQLSFGTVVGSDITTANTFFQNWNTVDATQTSTIATTTNAAIIGPISVTGSYVWSMNGTLNII